MAENKSIVMHNPGQVDAFGYSISFVKNQTEQTEEKAYDATNYVTEINVFESLFAKACQLQIGVFDGGGLMETMALQTGDFVDVTIMKDEDSEKVIKRFAILEIRDIKRVGNSQAKTYTISGVTMPAFKNKLKTVMRGLKGKHSDMVTTICTDFLDIPEVDVEPTYGDFTLVSPGRAPFKLLSQIMQHAISEENGETGSLYFFYEDRDGHKFWTLNKIIAEANTHTLSVSVDKNRDAESDLSKIQFFAQLKAGSQTERIASGMYENEVIEFNHLSRNITSTKWKLEESGEGLLQLGSALVVDKANNLKQWTDQTESKIRGLPGLSKFRSADEAFDGVNNFGRKFGSVIAQKAMFNQIIYAIQIFGNTNIKAGDLVDITSPALAMQTDAPELDFSLVGRFLVGDVRHRIVDGEQFITVLNIFKDGYEAEFTPQASK